MSTLGRSIECSLVFVATAGVMADVAIALVPPRIIGRTTGARCTDGDCGAALGPQCDLNASASHQAPPSEAMRASMTSGTVRSVASNSATSPRSCTDWTTTASAP